jgi:hypothetical protein
MGKRYELLIDEPALRVVSNEPLVGMIGSPTRDSPPVVIDVGVFLGDSLYQQIEFSSRPGCKIPEGSLAKARDVL